MSGTPFATARSTLTRPVVTAGKEAPPGDSLLPDLPLSPWGTFGTQDTGEDSAPGQQNRNSVRDPYDIAPPVLSQRFNLPSVGGPQFSFDYRLTPATASELTFRKINWTEQEKIDWDASTILMRLRSDGSLGLNVSHSGGGAYSGALRLSGTGSLQNYWYHRDEPVDVRNNSLGTVLELKVNQGDLVSAGDTIIVTDTEEIRALRRGKVVYLVSVGEILTERKVVAQLTQVDSLINYERAYNETFFTSSWDFSASVRPLFQSAIWGSSSISYSLRGLLGKTTVDISDIDNPEWNWTWMDWDKDIQTHQVSLNLSANIMDHNQTISVSAVLPPKDAMVSASAVFRAWISETSIRTSIREPLKDDLRKFEPIYITETLNLGSWGRFRQYLVITPEDDRGFTTVTSDLSIYGFTASFSMTYARPWEFNRKELEINPNAPLWTQEYEDEFGATQFFDDRLVPKELRFGYVKTFTKNNLWGKRLSFSFNIDTSLTFDLQRYTNSRMSFGLGINIGIANFLDINFSTRSENAVMYKYFQDIFFFDKPPMELYPGSQTNIFTDLFYSFAFWDDDLRRRSGFKLKSMNLSLIHHLGDWNAKLTVSMLPELYRPPYPDIPYYRFNTEVSFLIQWIPIGEIKTQIDYNKNDGLVIK